MLMHAVLHCIIPRFVPMSALHDTRLSSKLPASPIPQIFHVGLRSYVEFPDKMDDWDYLAAAKF